MPLFGNALAGAAGSGGADAFKIERSLRFDDTASSNLSRHFEQGSQKKWTWSAWVKRSKLIDNNYLALFTAPVGSSANDGIFFRNNGISLSFGYAGSGIECYTSSVFHDTAAWYNICVSVNTDEATAANRIKVWVNNQLHTLNQYPSQGATAGIGSASLHHLGLWVRGGTTNYPFSGYLAAVHYLDGIAITSPEGVFGEYSSTTGAWDPIEYTGNYTVAGSGSNYLAEVTASNGFKSSKPKENMFDGSTSTVCENNASSNTEHITWTPTTPIQNVTSLRVYATLNSNQYDAREVSVNGGSYYNPNIYGSSQWWDLIANTQFNSGDTLSEIKFQVRYFAGGQPSNAVRAIEVNGTILQVVPAAPNGFQLDFDPAAAGQIFSEGTLTGSIDAGNPITRGFDGDLTTGTWAASSAGFELTFPTALTVANSITVVGGSAQSNYKVIVGGTEHTITFPNGSSSYTQEVTVNVSGSFTGVKGTNNAGELRGIRVDGGPLLVDHEAPGVDASGTGNHWKANNIASSGILSSVAQTVTITGNTRTERGPYSKTARKPVAGDAITDPEYSGSLQSGNTSGDAVTVSFNPAFTGVIYAGNSGGGVVSINGGTEFTPQSNVSYALNPIAVTNCTSFYSKTTATGQRGWISVAFRDDGTQVYNSSDVFVDVDTTRDSPTNYESNSNNNGGNYPTLNILAYGDSITYSKGNLRQYSTTSAWTNNTRATATIGVSSGKWYWEQVHSTHQYSYTGIISDADFAAAFPGHDTTSCGYQTSNGAGYPGSGANIQTSGGYPHGAISEGDIIMFALDLDNQKMWIGRNGTWLNAYDTGQAGNPATGANSHFTNIVPGRTYFPSASTYGTVTIDWNYGANDNFTYTPPTGYKSICTQNLPDPLIAKSSDHFDTKLYTGDGSNSRTVSGYGFSPDLLWVKDRSNTSGDWSHRLSDAVRGAGVSLSSNNDAIERDSSAQAGGGVETFTSDGFTIQQGTSTNNNQNNNGSSYVAWAWNIGANSNKTYAVTVVADSGNKYRFDGHGTSAVTLDLEEGSTYVFDQSDSSNSGHPLRFSTTSNGTHGGGSEYTTGVTVTGTPGSAGAKTTIVVASGAPVLHYYCSAHSGMGGQINTNSTAGATVLASSLNNSIYDTSDTWSARLSSPQGSYGNSSTTNAFDGNLTVGFEAGNPSGGYSTIRFQPASAITVSSQIRIHVFDYNAQAVVYQYRVNDGSWTTMPGTSSPYRRWQDLGFTGTLNSFEYRSNTNSTYKPTLYAVEIDGKLLINSGTSLSGFTQYPSINSVVRANPTAGISCVSYTGNGTNNTSIGHGLNVTAPSLIIIKNRDQAGTNWGVLHTSAGTTGTILDGNPEYYMLSLDQTIGASDFTADNIWHPTAATFKVNGANTSNWTNYNGNKYIAYCFAPVEGFSSFGSYVGNGSSDGIFVHTGFRVSWYLVKKINAAGENWRIIDSARSPYNVAENRLLPNSTAVEGAQPNEVDFLSNGFKFLSADGAYNGSGSTYVYAAFGDPFKYARAR